MPALMLMPDDRRPLVEQIFAALSQHIASGKIAPGTRLPASRALAGELGVSRSTVVSAYDQLTAEGYLSAQRGSGHYVCDVGDADALYALAPSPPAPFIAGWGRNAGIAASPGIPDMRLFPYAAWARHVARTARQSAESLLETEDRRGLPRLRAAIAMHLAAWRGIDASAERIVITAGAGDALELALRTLTRQRREVALENPTYPPLHRMAENMGLTLHWMNIGGAGAALPDASARPVVTVLTPSYQFPLGGAMPRSQRLAFLERAERDDGWIIEDDFDSEFRYAGRPIPALASLDLNHRVIYVGSFSKIFSSGLRIGYMVLPETLLPSFSETLQQFGQRASVAPQWPLASFIEDGSFHRHIRRMRRIYGERRQGLVDLLRDRLRPPIRFDDHKAGMQIALRFPKGWDDRVLSSELNRDGIACLPLSAFYHRAPAETGLLIGFSTVTPDEAHQRVDRLIAVIERYDPNGSV